ncbi:MAG: V/A-type H+/Na+-transporting ATPase subunit [Methanosarcinales archaeon]|nr:V/A-type H+/Na+-transporting ATPase subunit [Methanosarcinales archaeon]
MLRPEKMELVRVTGVRRDLEKVIEALHKAGCVQLEKVSDEVLEHTQPDKPLDKFPTISEQLMRLRGLEAALKPRHIENMYEKLPLEQMLEQAREIGIDDELAALLAEKEKLNELRREQEGIKEVVSELEAFGLDFSLFEVESVAFISGRIEASEFEQFISALSERTTKFDYLVGPPTKTKRGKQVVFLLAVDKKLASETLELLEGFSCSILDLPRVRGKPGEVIAQTERKLVEIASELSRIEARIDELSDEYYEKVAVLREMFEIEAEQAKAPLKFAREEHIFVLTGWIPVRNRQSIEQTLNAITEGRTLIETENTDELPPTLLNNPRALKSMEFLVGFFSWPKSTEWDPTIFMAITFPIFFGMMLGDIGYALLILGLSYLLIKKLSRYAAAFVELGEALIFAAIATIVFGLIYGEFFGLEIPFYEPLLPRLHAVPELLVLIIFVGIAHITLGYVLGIIHTYKHREYDHMLSKMGWLLILYGGVLLVYNFFMDVPLNPMASASSMLGVGMLLGGLLINLKTEGPMAVMEISSLASFVLSYTRILGVGLVSLILALVLDERLAIAIEHGSITLILVMLLIFLIGHTVNFVLGVFEPFLQSIRLHYVEFFSRFYEGNGVLFAPFRFIGKYVKYGHNE